MRHINFFLGFQNGAFWGGGAKIRTRSTTTRDRNLQFRGAVSTGGSPLVFFSFLSSIYVQFSKTSPLNLEKVAKNPVEKFASNPVTSAAVMFFSALKKAYVEKVDVLFPSLKDVLLHSFMPEQRHDLENWMRARKASGKAAGGAPGASC